ncbi:GntP family permease [Clostridium oceanicum]|uniref:GntP family permease n=1 Tax=Clostridium oceanicum TaxID=1543 RepID=A0ABP3UGV6_9CLOT
MSMSVIAVVISIVVLVILIARFKINAFIALLLTTLGLALALGNSGAEAVDLVIKGFGQTMGSCGIIIVLGVIIGFILEKTGGAEKIAASVLSVVKEKKASLAMCITGSLVSIPVFADSALMILFPVIKNLSRKAKTSFMGITLGTVMCLAMTHSIIPPTPGPIAAAGLLGADLGKVIFYGIMIAIPATLSVYLYSSKVIGKRWNQYVPEIEDRKTEEDKTNLFKESVKNPKGYPTWGAYMPIVIPIILIVFQSFCGNFLPKEHILNTIFGFIGNPIIALLIGIAVIWMLTREYKTSVRAGWLDKAMDSTALVLLITAAGGAYGYVIKSSDIGACLSQSLSGLGLPGVLLPWLISATIVTATGSTTVALTTSAAVCVSFLPTLGISPELCVLAIASGGMCVLHVNSSMFWLVQRMCKIPVTDLLKAIVPLSMVCSFAALASTYLLSLLGI